MSRKNTTNFETLYMQCCRPMSFTFSLTRKQITSWETQCVDRTSGMGKSDGFWAACASHSSSLSEPGAHFSCFLCFRFRFLGGRARRRTQGTGGERQIYSSFLRCREQTILLSHTMGRGNGGPAHILHNFRLLASISVPHSKKLKRPSYSSQT